MKQYLVYVEVPVIAVGKMAIFISDEADLKKQLGEYEEEFRKQPLTYKPQRDQKGKVVLHELSPDWDINE